MRCNGIILFFHFQKLKCTRPGVALQNATLCSKTKKKRRKTSIVSDLKVFYTQFQS